MGGGRFVRNAAHEHDDLTDGQFRHRARVAVGRVEHRNARIARRIEIDLIGADAEAAHHHQPVGGGKHRVGQLGAAADAEDVHALERVDQILAVERTLDLDDVLIARLLEQIDRSLMHPFEQQDFDTVFGKRQAFGGNLRL